MADQVDLRNYPLIQAPDWMDVTFTFSLGPQIQAFLAVASSSVHAQLIADSQLNQPDCVSVGVCVCVV